MKDYYETLPVEELRKVLKWFEEKVADAQTDFDRMYWNWRVRDTEIVILSKTLLPELKNIEVEA